MYRFGQAAAAIGITEAALRNWMTRNTIDLWGERPAAGWRTFTKRDVLVLALANEMVRYGAKVDHAVRAVQFAMADAPGADPYRLPAELYAVALPDGTWDLRGDEGAALAVAARPTLIKLFPTRIMAPVNHQLVKFDAEAEVAHMLRNASDPFKDIGVKGIDG